MVKKKPLFPKKQLALFLCVVITLCLCLLILLLPDRRRTETADDSGSRSRTEETLTEQERGRSGERQSQYGETQKASRGDKPSGETSATGTARATDSKNVQVRGSRKRLVIVIDDVGQNIQDLEPFLRIPAPLTFAVLPHLPFSREATQRIKAAGKEAILHMPMEPAGQENPGPGALYCAYSEQQLVTHLEQACASVPGVRGFNNHMGSLVTANLEVMRVILRYAAAKKLFFLDSRTTSATVAAEVAQEYGVPFFARNLFLDNEPEAAAIRLQLEKAVELLSRTKSLEAVPARPLIAIGHVQSHELPAQLLEVLPFFEKEGVELARLDEFCN